jgi:hypothetical protein
MAGNSCCPSGELNIFYLSIFINLLLCLYIALGFYRQHKQPKRTLFIHISGQKENSENSDGSRQIFISGTGKQLAEGVLKPKGRVHISLEEDQTESRNGFKFDWTFLILAILLVVVVYNSQQLGIYHSAEMPQNFEAAEDTYQSSDDTFSDKSDDTNSNTEREFEDIIWSKALKWFMNSISLELNVNLKSASS